MSDAAIAAPDLRAYSTPAVNPWIIALVVTMATFMEVLDTSIANVSLPHIAGGLSAGVDESTWILTSYLVSNAIILPMSGWFSNLIGRKRFYMTCVAVFTISSFLCGLAPNLGALIFFRVLQGVGGGGLQPSEQAILADTFPPAKRGMAFAIYGMAVVVAPAIGPTLGGFITDNYSWRWIFYINVPIGIISLLLTSRLISDPPHLNEARKTKLQHRLHRPGFARARAWRAAGGSGQGAARRLVRVAFHRYSDDDRGRCAGRRHLLGVAPRPSHHRSEAVPRPLLRDRQRADVHRWASCCGARRC